ncbi:nitroreductase family protein [Ruixingdingia sedimenti]|uniref:Putative NAD(P)H nitroreductase n=1 Tax=Ruixingdingia sedimenti TaxID=3073604 RepID=A0ABU1F2S3_9RHOB|nr:nitroreductase family protein [Xinfangfangia sp. LG-4]MDR5651156.1 nitroreductase family protein [Xinfangfangia sp. LG-4]
MTDQPAPPQDARHFLLTRRSVPLRTLATPAPDRHALAELLTAAARVPDHGKLEPWRFVVLERPALERLAAAAAAQGPALGIEPDRIAKGQGQFAESPLAVAVIAAPRESPVIPPVEQVLSAGAVCLSLLNAALAAGWGASWLTGWVAHDRRFAEPAFGLGPQEWVAGIVHIGTRTAPPPERPRPDIGAITTWVSE